jgi:signal transduction histidine kinase
VEFDNHVRGLCERLLNSSSDEEAILLASELKDALHQHVESLRTQLKVSLRQPPPDGFQEPA